LVREAQSEIARRLKRVDSTTATAGTTRQPWSTDDHSLTVPPLPLSFPKADPLLHMLLVFGHLLAASMALGAIVASDLRLLSNLSQDKVRIAPPNQFVMRIVMVALLLLFATGGAIVVHGLSERADYLDNPKLLVKNGLVVVLALNAFLLHYVTFPRLARGRRVARRHLADWSSSGCR
jgi:putative copper export protein